MQLLATSSVEGVDENESRNTHGLNFISGRVESLQNLGCDLRIPHVGWNEVTSCTSNNGLFDGIPDGTDFYFVHSYAFVPDDSAHVLATTNYGIPITAAVRRGHIWGTQFHPEKSSRAGFQLLSNFIECPIC
jgi:glutamine amidotransferase